MTFYFQLLLSLLSMVSGEWRAALIGAAIGGGAVLVLMMMIGCVLLIIRRYRRHKITVYRFQDLAKAQNQLELTTIDTTTLGNKNKEKNNSKCFSS